MRHRSVHGPRFSPCRVVPARAVVKLSRLRLQGPAFSWDPPKLSALLNCPVFPRMGLARAEGARRETVAGTSEFSELLPFKLLLAANRNIMSARTFFRKLCIFCEIVRTNLGRTNLRKSTALQIFSKYTLHSTSVKSRFRKFSTAVKSQFAKFHFGEITV